MSNLIHVNAIERIFRTKVAAIGMIHLLPLPGSPRFRGSLSEVISAARRDAKALEDGGIDGMMIENFGDYPYPVDRIPLVTVTSMTSVVKEISKEIDRPFGINVLANDYLTELGIAYATGGLFVRVEAYVDTVVTDAGTLKPAASRLQRYMRTLGGEVAVFADIQVKHSYPIVAKELAVSAKESEKMGLADAVIVTGKETGAETPAQAVAQVRKTVAIPVVVGAGVTPDNVMKYVGIADAFLVGTSIKEGSIESPVDVGKVRRLMDAVRKIR
jgi:membrane complex biogenesis BtpA family protein